MSEPEATGAAPSPAGSIGDLAAGTVLFLIALYALIESILMPHFREGIEGFYSSPGFAPGLISIALMGLTAALILRNRHARFSFAGRTVEVETLRVLSVFGIIFVYVLVMPWIGYAPATFAMMLSFQLGFSRRRDVTYLLIWGVGLSAVITACLWWLFGEFFLIPLP